MCRLVKDVIYMNTFKNCKKKFLLTPTFKMETVDPHAPWVVTHVRICSRWRQSRLETLCLEFNRRETEVVTQPEVGHVTGNAESMWENRCVQHIFYEKERRQDERSQIGRSTSMWTKVQKSGPKYTRPFSKYSN